MKCELLLNFCNQISRKKLRYWYYLSYEIFILEHIFWFPPGGKKRKKKRKREGFWRLKHLPTTTWHWMYHMGARHVSWKAGIDGWGIVECSLPQEQREVGSFSFVSCPLPSTISRGPTCLIIMWVHSFQWSNGLPLLYYLTFCLIYCHVNFTRIYIWIQSFLCFVSFPF